ncbi:hypothetical protein KXD93_15630 [Mucilaginibacter sp. BJC16-A38]|uniref:hypothetical protein n=1 Tax=Mucilaginibacter phenanthrenivorans TaxID=1234842 RepID=UPI002157E2EA|nr:hypothetical protein [Mucilaginibacter phenanthrenivorans]MCR8559087.1 hypothetical protein [Mucilaginibacter phenanthrenivorans]
MKKLILSAFAVLIFAGSALAQNRFSSDDFAKNLGKTGTLCDTVYSLRIVSDTLTLLNMGAAYPNQKYTVAVKGNKITLDYTNLKGKPLCVTGVFLMYKNRPEIQISEPAQVNAK